MTLTEQLVTEFCVSIIVGFVGMGILVAILKLRQRYRCKKKKLEGQKKHGVDVPAP